MTDNNRFVKVLKDKKRREREMEREELKKTFLFIVETLSNACSALKAEIVKVLKKCLRLHRNCLKQNIPGCSYPFCSGTL